MPFNTTEAHTLAAMANEMKIHQAVTVAQHLQRTHEAERDQRAREIDAISRARG